MKLSYGAPSLHELRKLIPKQLVIKGSCLIGSLAARHLLIHCDLYEYFCSVLSKHFGYLQFNGEQHLFRNFSWTQNFNPKEETSKALAWVSLPNLPPNLFAQRPLLSIASAIGKPVAIDKATQDRTRPSTARVKVILDLMDKHPKRVRLHFLDEQSGKLVEHYQQVVFDNLPLYCTYCKHQGHEDADCRLMIQKNKRGEGNQDDIRQQGDKTNNLEQLQGGTFGAWNKGSGGPFGAWTRGSVVGKSLADATKTSDKGQGYQEGDTCIISCEDQVGSNAGQVLDRNSIATWKLENSGQQTCQTEVGQQLNYNATEKENVTATGVARVGSEPADTTNDKIRLQEKTTNSKAFVVASQLASGKLLTEDVAINTAATFVAQIKELGQSNIVDKAAGVTIDVGTQIGSPGACQIKLHVAPKLNMANSHALPIVLISQGTLTNNLITSSGQKGVTSESRWADRVEEEDEHVTTHRKLSPKGPIFVPKGSGITSDSSRLHKGRQLVLTGGDKELLDALVRSNVKKLTSLTPINTNKQLQDVGSSSFSTNRFANLQDEDTFEESEEEDMLNYCFANAARDADISPMQQRNNKKKHGRKNSWDGKMTEEFVPRHLPLRLAKQNHMTVSTTLTRSNKSKKN
ncbi:hypothetical protein KY285_019340 [Solanum tuberosum]|nr:hypothetical protein KY285_019340 [Solanum tuberosum]